MRQSPVCPRRCRMSFARPYELHAFRKHNSRPSHSSSTLMNSSSRGVSAMSRCFEFLALAGGLPLLLLLLLWFAPRCCPPLLRSSSRFRCCFCGEFPDVRRMRRSWKSVVGFLSAAAPARGGGGAMSWARLGMSSAGGSEKPRRCSSSSAKREPSDDHTRQPFSPAPRFCPRSHHAVGLTQWPAKWKMRGLRGSRCVVMRASRFGGDDACCCGASVGERMRSSSLQRSRALTTSVGQQAAGTISRCGAGTASIITLTSRMSCSWSVSGTLTTRSGRPGSCTSSSSGEQKHAKTSTACRSSHASRFSIFITSTRSRCASVARARAHWALLSDDDDAVP
mmetsp:Transcript_29202/g.89332  ORF Transcript_29202/g.89332 Transcript_29202/m.89332 type:complete len:337 (+) Transcript_29202:772-1782(+)